MRVRITALKTTGWPEGAKVGDVVEIKGDEIPGWALGKCVEAEADAPVTVGHKAKKGSVDKAAADAGQQ